MSAREHNKRVKELAEADKREFIKPELDVAREYGKEVKKLAKPGSARGIAMEVRALAKVLPQEARAVAKELRGDAAEISAMARRAKQAPKARAEPAHAPLPPKSPAVARAAVEHPFEPSFPPVSPKAKAAKSAAEVDAEFEALAPKAKTADQLAIEEMMAMIEALPPLSAETEAAVEKALEELHAEAEKPKASGGAGGPPKGTMPINPKILALKVGDHIGYSVGGHYMGDGGDSRDSAGYSVSFKITKIDGDKYHVTGGRYGHNSDFVVAIKKPSMGGSASSWGNSLHLVSGKAYGDRKDFTPTSYTRKDEDFGENEYNYAKMREILAKKAGAKASKTAADWTKGTKHELVRMIDKHFEAQGKEMRGHKTADKPRLIEIIRKYKIAE